VYSEYQLENFTEIFCVILSEQEITPQQLDINVLLQCHFSVLYMKY